jgi:hypothetical protein
MTIDDPFRLGDCRRRSFARSKAAIKRPCAESPAGCVEFDNAIRTLPRSISLSLGRDLNLTLLIVRIVCAPVSEHLRLHDLIGGITATGRRCVVADKI